jgi:hypothetical protein
MNLSLPASLSAKEMEGQENIRLLSPSPRRRGVGERLNF